MTFADIPAGARVFLDANTFVYHFIAHPVFGPPCAALLTEIEHKQVAGFISSHVLGEVAHRILTLEAQQTFGWPAAGMANRLKRHPAEVRRLTKHRQVIDEVSAIGVQVLPVDGSHVSLAADFTHQFGLLNNDALLVVVMRSNGLTYLASNDSDFDQIPGLTRFSPT